MGIPLIDDERIKDSELSPSEIIRYQRHLSLPGIGLIGQKRLKAARILCIGAGGLGSPILLYLAAAGVGTIGIIDDDDVDTSNLQRQIIHDHNSIGDRKTDSAAQKIHSLNPDCTVVSHTRSFDSSCAEEIVSSYDLVIDGSDNFPTRFLSADICGLLGVPLIWGSIARFDGQMSVFWTQPLEGWGPAIHLRDLYRDPPDGESIDCATGGVLGVLPGVIGTLMATEAIKLITGSGEIALGKIMMWDALSGTFNSFDLGAVAGSYSSSELLAGGSILDSSSPRHLSQSTSESESESTPTESITARELQALLNEEKSEQAVLLIDVRELDEYPGGVIGNPVLLPLSLIEQDPEAAAAEMEKRISSVEQTVVVYCASGRRSQRAISHLRKLGFLRLVNLSGGILSWWQLH